MVSQKSWPWAQERRRSSEASTPSLQELCRFTIDFRMDPQQFDLEDLEEVRVNAMQHAKACAKKPWQRDVLRRKSGHQWR